MFSEKETWNEEKILAALKQMVIDTGQVTMPTHSEIKKYFGDYKLSNAMSKRKGTKYYANMLGLEIKSCESDFGDRLENYCLNQLEDMGLCAEKTKVRYPYDILVERAVKIDVKACKPFKNYDNSTYYTFNLEKKEQTCDVYVFYCLNETYEIIKTLIIPSYVLSGKTQLSIGVRKSKYNKYTDRWDIIQQYCDFIKSIS